MSRQRRSRLPGALVLTDLVLDYDDDDNDNVNDDDDDDWDNCHHRQNQILSGESV